HPAAILVISLDRVPKQLAINSGANALAKPDQAIMTRLNTLCLLTNAQPSAARVTITVAILSSNVRSIFCGSKSCVSAAEQFKTNESAVDMVAAKMPASTSPTSTGGNNCSAMVGNASSASKAPVSAM